MEISVVHVSGLASCVSAFVAIAIFWHNVRDKRFDKIDARFDKIDDQFKEVRHEMKEMRNDISDLRERMSAIEMSTIFLHVNPTPPSKSDIAKMVWERRKSKQISKGEE